MPSKLFTIAELAEYLHVSERTLERWRSTGRGPKFRPMSGNQQVRYREEAVEEWLASGELDRETVTGAA